MLNEKKLIEEATYLVEKAEENNIIMRLMGAIAFKIHCINYAELYNKIGRTLSDMDFVSYSRYQHDVRNLFKNLGYKERVPTMAMHLGARQIWLNKDGIVIDIFFDQMYMCHNIDYRDRLEIDKPTVPLAELLLQKLQVVNFTEKDLKDSIMLILEHEMANGDNETINIKRIAEMLSDDWGFYYTSTINLQKIKNSVDKYDVLSKKEKDAVKGKIDALIKTIEEHPKTMKWKMRSKLGTKVKWYRTVETISK
ncbi:MAG: hypothetical protein QXJ53_01495 [Candidatus Bathyarchaeia archaeon]